MILTPKQEHFIKFIENFIHENNHSPSYMEISKGLNIKSIGTVSWYVSTLEKKGIIKRNYGYNGKRAITINNKKRELQYLTIANISSTSQSLYIILLLQDFHHQRKIIWTHH